MVETAAGRKPVRRGPALARASPRCDVPGMTTGLASFDAFSWASLLAGREALVVDGDSGRGRRVAAALEEAGAVATLAPGQVIGADRLRDRRFRLVVLGLVGDEAITERLEPHLPGLGGGLVILAEPDRQADLRAFYPAARVGGHGMGDRDLVMFVIADADE